MTGPPSVVTKAGTQVWPFGASLTIMLTMPHLWWEKTRICCKIALAKRRAINIIRRSNADRGVQGCGSSSVVEHHVANVRVEGSNPFSRSIPSAF